MHRKYLIIRELVPRGHMDADSRLILYIIDSEELILQTLKIMILELKTKKIYMQL